MVRFYLEPVFQDKFCLSWFLLPHFCPSQIHVGEPIFIVDFSRLTKHLDRLVELSSPHQVNPIVALRLNKIGL